jgi:predicted alpha/beta-hydrolase family hydrolase
MKILAMLTKVLQIIGVALLLVPPASAQMPKGEYLDGAGSKAGVILAHGQGLTPTSQVVDPLRKAIHKELGMHTLSLQLPVVAGSRSPDKFQEYGATFPEAYKAIEEGIKFFKEKGIERVYLMGYSMGGRMTSGFLSEKPGSGIIGFIGVGLLGGGQPPLNTNVNLRNVKIPVIDIYAENDNDARAAEFRKPFISSTYVQVPIAGAKHDYRCCESEVSANVVKWLAQQENKK